MNQTAKPTTGRVTPLDKAALHELTEASRRSPFRAYGIAVGATLTAFALTMLFEAYLGRTLFLLFWPAVVITAWLGGFGPALVTSAGAVALVDYFVVPPRGFQATTEEVATFAAFLAMAALASWAVSIVDKARLSAAVAARENASLALQLDQQSTELSQQLEESQAMQEELELSAEELAEHSAEAEAADRFSRGILESISDPFIVLDADWRFHYANLAAQTIFSSLNPGETAGVIGKIFWDAYSDIKGTRFETEIRRAADTRSPVSFEEYYPALATWGAVFCYPLPDGGLAIQWKDITSRKQAEESESYLTRASNLLSSSLDYESTLKEIANLIVPHFADWCGINVVDEGGEPRQLAVAHVDPEKVKWAIELNRRYPPDLNARTGIGEVIRTGKAELYPEIPPELLEAGAVDAEHLRIMKELGLRSAMVVPLAAGQRILGAISVISAESGRRYTEADLAFMTELARRSALAVENARLHKAEQDARRSAEAANEAKTQFLAVMSHELRTPLNAIGGYAELLLLGIRGSVSEDQRADLERIQRSQRNLLSLINDILNYAKLEAGHVEFDMGPVAIHPLLLDIESLITPQLRSRDLIYDYSGCDGSLAAWGDAEKIRQILLNLLSNAIKFTEPGGTIAISCTEDEELVSIVVRDTGLGIPADRLASVFEPFVQLERRLTSNHEGTGLGLAISRDLARGLGGELTARSTLGEGSEFELKLKKVPSRSEAGVSS